MDFLFLVLMAAISFGGFILGYHFFKKDGLYVFAIGSVVAANIFDIGSYGISIGSLTFGIDSVIYTVFIFCVVVMLFDYGIKEAKTLTYSAMASILFSGIIQFVVFWATSGISSGIVWGLCSFCISILATYAAVMLAFLFYEKTKNKINKYLMLLILIVIASVINSIIFFGVVALVNGGVGSNFAGVMAGSYIGKTMSALFAVLSYFVVCFIKGKTKNKVIGKTDCEEGKANKTEGE